jgi:hypothetical protein
LHPRIEQFLTLLLHFAEGDYSSALESGGAIFSNFIDPEGRFYWVRHLGKMGDVDRALSELERVVADGYFCASTFASDPWLAALRTRPEFEAIQRDATERRARAVAVFREAGGPQLLGDEEIA